MKFTQQKMTTLLMAFSVLLLLALQGFWLSSSYEKAFLDLRKESSELLRSTIHDLRDSILMKSLVKVTADSVPGATSAFEHQVDTILTKASRLTQIQHQQNQSQIRIYISSTRSDSIKSLLRPLSTRVQDGQLRGGNFIFRAAFDSISLDSVRAHYQDRLQASGLALAFDITHDTHVPPVALENGATSLLGGPPDRQEFEEQQRIYGKSLKTEWIRYDPLHRYAAVFPSVTGYLLNEILPQILFSVFLTVITCASFALMYRNLKTQQRLMEMKNDFISNITHELKTPITTVSVALEALRNFKGLENPKLTADYLEIAQGELNRLTILTDKILKTAIYENRGVDFEPEPVDLEKLIQQILASMRLLFERNKASVSFEKSGDHFVISGAGVHLTNVIYNLIDNALKYSPSEPRIQISLRDREGTIELLVRDEGIGIPQEYRTKVFEKFFRVPTGDVHNIKGYGLGLSYVESVVRSHHGSIEVVPVTGPGSLFRITLPKVSS